MHAVYVWYIAACSLIVVWLIGSENEDNFTNNSQITQVFGSSTAGMHVDTQQCAYIIVGGKKESTEPDDQPHFCDTVTDHPSPPSQSEGI